MALLTAAELKASREAQQAGVATLSDSVVTAAIAEAEAALYSDNLLGYRVDNTATTLTVRGSGKDRLVLPERVRSISALTEQGTAVASTGYRTAHDGFVLERIGGYAVANADQYATQRWYWDTTIIVTGTFGYTTTDDAWILAKKWLRIAAVDYLKQTSPQGGVPGNLTDYSAEGASFSFAGDASARGDLARLIEQIGRHPYKKSGGLRSVEVA